MYAKWILGIPTALALVFIVIWEGLLISQKPVYDGEVLVPGILSDVTVTRDSYGVPHIRAQDPHSAFYALGYVTAQDRLFQMEMIRRLSQGRLSEIIGEDLLPIDRMFRSLRFEKWAKSYSKTEEKLRPEAWKNLDSYVSGVNAFIEEGNLPIEYSLMGFGAEPFRREDALTSLAYMGFSFADAFRSDSLYSILEERYPDSKIPDLFPRYDYEEGGSILNDQPTRPDLAKITPKNRLNNTLNNTEGKTRTKEENDHATTLASVKDFLVAVHPVFEQVPIFEGSNSWVLSGDRMESGKPVLVNDPHIGYSNPGTWYEVHMEFPGMNLYGYFLPGSPYPLLGNTDEMAWGLTMLANDDMDLYYETLNEEETRVLHKNQWVDLVSWEEEIKVRGKESEIYTVRLTPRGSIYTDFIEGYEGRPLSLYWTFHEDKNPLLDVLHGMLFSQNMNEMRSYAGLIAAPGLNISYANKQGDIAWWAVGRFPIRKPGVNRRKIMEGSDGSSDVLGFLPFRLNPKLENPKNGIIATANNLASRDNFPGLGRLEGYWQPSDRFRRITEVLSKKEKFSIQDMEDLLVDVQSFSAPRIWDVYIHSYQWENDFWKSQNAEKRNLAREAIRILSDWDFETDKKSRGATVYYVLTYFAMKNMLEDEMGEDLLKIYASTTDNFTAFKHLSQKPEHPLWDDVNTPERRENRSDILDRSLVDTIHYLQKNVSKTPGLWTWGNLYSVEYVHAIGRKKPFNYLFNVGPHPTMGAPEVVNNTKAKLLHGNFAATAGPSTRRIVGFENQDENRTILPIGNSGNLASPYYGDQVHDYLDGNFRKTWISPEAVETNKKHELILKNK